MDEHAGLRLRREILRARCAGAPGSVVCEGSMSDEIDHVAFVDAWLDRSAKDASPEQLVQLLDAALRGLLGRTETTLGEVTLSAIADRVLHNTTERFAGFATLRFNGGEGVNCQQLAAQARSLHKGELRDGVRFLIVELLSVLGNLTAEILTPELHAELSKIALEAPSNAPRSEDTRP